MTAADKMADALRDAAQMIDNLNAAYGSEAVDAVAQAARAALAAHEAEREGWQWVPKEPTHAMLLAYAKAWDGFEIRGTTVGQRAAHEYKAMLAAAAPSKQEQTPT
jgi:hypothetical protein